MKTAASVLRTLEYNDQGMINANILLNKLDHQTDDDIFVQEQGEILFQILEDLANHSITDPDVIKSRIQPIVDAYNEKYNDIPNDNKIDDHVINDNMKYPEYWETAIERNKPLDENDIKRLSDILGLNKTEEEEDDEFEEDSDDTEYEYDGDVTSNDKQWIRDYKKYLSALNELEKEYLTEKNKEESKTGDNSIKINKSKNAKCKGCGNYLLGTFDYFHNPTMYQLLNSDDYIIQNKHDNDDNQFITGNYNWKERIIFDDVEEILNTIQRDVDIHEKNLKNRKKKEGINTLKKQFYRDFIRYYVDHIGEYSNRKHFCVDFILWQKIPKNTWEIVTDIKNKMIKSKRKGYKDKKDPDAFLSYETLNRVIKDFESKDEEERQDYLINGKDIINHGGYREKVQKVSNETLLCIIVLILDFPTLSAESIANYCNSKYGPNYGYQNHITGRTVQRYLSFLQFNVKKASFAPPNRNSIGLRINRVAWCKIIQKISDQDNVLLAFIDEAAVTSCEGRRYGRSFIGITPVINCPLSKVKVTIVAMVIPCFGVVYKFIDNSCDGTKYANFLRDATVFLRKYICNKDTEIVYIEDNCPIHGTDEVEEEIINLKIAVIPTVPFSPCLNEVVEGYFGLVKSNNMLHCSGKKEIFIRASIEKSWKVTTNHIFDDMVSVSLLSEWKNRMKICMEGKPIYSSHISLCQFDAKDNLFKNLEVMVDRIKDDIESQ